MTLVLLFGFLFACDTEAEQTWEQFNGDADSVEIDVGAPDLLPDVSVVLTSTTGAVEVGLGTVSPGGGPIGTEHECVVQVDEAYAGDVDRVSVRTSSGDRGEDEYDLKRDSAGEGYWSLDLQSAGEEGERRTDVVTFRLWTSVEEE